MAANKSPKEGVVYFPYQDMTPVEQHQLFTQFDINCEIDSAEILEHKKETKFLKKVCLYKVIIGPLECILTLLMFGKTEASYKNKITRLYWMFLRNKITLEKFGKELTKLLQSGKVI